MKRLTSVGVTIFMVGVISLSFVSIFAAGFFAPSSAGRNSVVVSKPLMSVEGAASSSLNWGGYAVTGPDGSVTQVQGSWIVPSVSCSKSSTYAAFWVGIDGFNSNTVEQTGVLAECSGGSAVYYAWYEFYPNPMYEITSVAVAPGDTITASVTGTGSSNFQVSISSSGGGSYSTTQSVSGADMSSGEWIVERPSLCSSTSCTLSTLADFGTSDFGLQYTGVQNTSFATVSGVTQAAGSFSTITPITMVSSSNSVLGQPSSPMSDGGTSFYFNYGAITTSTSTTSSTTSTTTVSSSTTSTTTHSSSTSTSTTSSTTTRHHFF